MQAVRRNRSGYDCKAAWNALVLPNRPKDNLVDVRVESACVNFQNEQP